MRTKRVVVVGASAGGIEALRTMVSGLPADFAAALCIVLHISPESPGILGDILSRSGPLSATPAVNGEQLQAGRVYVAPPDYHLLVEPGRLRLTKGPRENRFRPAIDPLFRSAAQVYGPGAIGVILTGSLDDGTAGLWAIKQLGGTAIVQDPAEALFTSMPQNAIDHVDVDQVLPLAAIAPRLVELTTVGVAADAVVSVPDPMDIEVRIAMEANPIDAGLQRLWIAIRALEEGQLLMGRMAEHVRTHDVEEADRLCEKADEAKQQSDAIRKLVTERSPLPVGAQ